MGRQPFFRRVWQFNAIAIAVLSLFGLLIGSFAAYHIVRDTLRDRHAGGLARTAPDSATPDTDGGDAQVDTARLSLSYFRRLTGTAIFYAPLQLQQTYGLALASKQATSTANYVFYDTTSGQSHSVLQGNAQIISEFAPVRTLNASSRTPPVLLLFKIIEKDTNGDGYLNAQDAKRIALAKPDGRQLTRLSPMVDAVLGHTLAPDGTLIVIGRSGKDTTAYRIDAETFAITAENPITKTSS